MATAGRRCESRDEDATLRDFDVATRDRAASFKPRPGNANAIRERPPAAAMAVRRHEARDKLTTHKIGFVGSRQRPRGAVKVATGVLLGPGAAATGGCSTAARRRGGREFLLSAIAFPRVIPWQQLRGAVRAATWRANQHWAVDHHWWQRPRGAVTVATVPPEAFGRLCDAVKVATHRSPARGARCQSPVATAARRRQGRDRERRR